MAVEAGMAEWAQQPRTHSGAYAERARKFSPKVQGHLALESSKFGPHASTELRSQLQSCLLYSGHPNPSPPESPGQLDGIDCYL